MANSVEQRKSAEISSLGISEKVYTHNTIASRSINDAKPVKATPISGSTDVGL